MEWEKDSVMWNWVRVTIWPSFAAPTPTIRCQFSSSIIPPPLLRLLLLPQLPVTVHRNPISHQPRHPRLWLQQPSFHSLPPRLCPSYFYLLYGPVPHRRDFLYQLQYQWLQLLPAPVPVTTTSISFTTTASDASSVITEDRKGSHRELSSFPVKTIYPVKSSIIFPTCTP